MSAAAAAEGPSLTAEEIAAKIGVDPATKLAGGVRVSHPHPHPHTEKTEKQQQDDEKKLKEKQDHEAYALSNQVAELEAVHSGSVQQEILKHSSKAVPSTYNYPPQSIHSDDRHKGRGEPVRTNRHIQQPSGKNGHNNFGH